MFMFSMLTIAQENYNVIIMPKKFDVFKNDNQYNLNVLCKTFFEKEGFKVYYDSDNLPNELANNRCSALLLNFVDDSNMFKTKIKIELKDCLNKVVATSLEGETREKKLDKAYNEATRNALVSLSGNTKIKNTTEIVANKDKNDVEIVEMDENSNLEKSKTLNAFKKGLNFETTKNGFNIVDENKKILFELFRTSNPTIYIAKKGEIQGVFTIYSSDKSEFEYYQNNELVVEKVALKF